MFPAGMNYTHKLCPDGISSLPSAACSSQGWWHCSLHLSGTTDPLAIDPYPQRPTCCWEALPKGNKLMDAGTELESCVCALPGCAQARLCWDNLLWQLGFMGLWLDSISVWVVSPSPFLSCYCPGRKKLQTLSLCPEASAVIPTAPDPLGAQVMAWQRRLSRDVRQQLGGRKAPGAIW